MRIIILGSTGYLGSKVVKRLAEMHHYILCLIREESKMDNLSDVIGNVDVCCINDFHEYLEKQTQDYDCLFNAACKYEKNDTRDIDIIEANLFVPLKIFSECLCHGVKKYITVGTGLPRDFNMYSFTKEKFAEFGKWYSERSQLRGNNIQFCNVELESFYGKDEPEERFISGTLKKLKKNEKIFLTDGNQKRDFVFIEDVVRMLVDIIQKKDLPAYLDVPLGTGTGVPVREAVTYLKEITCSESELCFGALKKRLFEPDSWADLTTMKELNLNVKYDWKDGFKMII